MSDKVTVKRAELQSLRAEVKAARARVRKLEQLVAALSRELDATGVPWQDDSRSPRRKRLTKLREQLYGPPPSQQED